MEAHPNEGPGLLKHIQLVNRLAFSHKDWLFYDTQFRRQKAAEGTPFGEYLLETFDLARERTAPNTYNSPYQYNRQGNQNYYANNNISRNLRQAPNTNNPSPDYIDPSHRYAQMVCYKYNNTGFCNTPNCNFANRCAICFGTHRTRACHQRSQPNKRFNVKGITQGVRGNKF